MLLLPLAIIRPPPIDRSSISRMDAPTKSVTAFSVRHLIHEAKCSEAGTRD